MLTRVASGLHSHYKSFIPKGLFVWPVPRPGPDYGIRELRHGDRDVVQPGARRLLGHEAQQVLAMDLLARAGHRRLQRTELEEREMAPAGGLGEGIRVVG